MAEGTQHALVIWDNQNHEELTFPLLITETDVHMLEVTGLGWLSKFPDDIAMLVEMTPEFT